MVILVAGAAGFIGSHLCKRLLATDTFKVIAVDNFEPYYSPSYKRLRFNHLCPNLEVHEFDLTNKKIVNDLFHDFKFDVCINLAATPGVRSSINEPYKYLHNNLNIHLNLIEATRLNQNKARMIFASSSSVYGEDNFLTKKAEDQQLSLPSSFYAYSKKSCEEISIMYAKSYDISTVALRFFTVYGPWGRPDMAYWSFTEKMLKDEELPLFNGGDMHRCFTHVDDIVSSIRKIAESDRSINNYEVINIGNTLSHSVNELVNEIAKSLNIRPKTKTLPKRSDEPLQIVPEMKKAKKMFDIEPMIDFKLGIKEFVNWYVRDFSELM